MTSKDMLRYVFLVFGWAAVSLFWKYFFKDSAPLDFSECMIGASMMTIIAAVREERDA